MSPDLKNFLIGLGGSLVSTGVVAVVSYFFIKNSVYKKFQKYTQVKDSASKISSQLVGSKAILVDFKTRATNHIISKSGDTTLSTWLDSEIIQVINQIDGAISTTDTLIGSIEAVERAGDELK